MAGFLHISSFKNALRLTLLLSAISSTLHAQVRFTASANEQEIGKNDLVQIQFRIENAGSLTNIEPPDFKNFEIVSGPNQETSTFISNGKRSTSAAITFILRPTKPGKYSFDPAVATVDGGKIKSNSLTLKVLDKVSAGKSSAPVSRSPFSGFGNRTPSTRTINEDFVLKKGENADKKIKKNLILELDADKTTAYVGQPIVVSFKLYTRLLSKTSITDAPSFNGFSVSEMNVPDNAQEEKLDGRKFSCYTLRKVQLFPTQAGTFTLSPLYAENKISFLRDNGGKNPPSDPLLRMMDDLGIQDLGANGMIEKNVKLASNDLKIKVKPLPEKNKPDNFTGAVGSFQILSNLQNDHLSTDDAGSLKVTIKGAGNLTLASIPQINWPTGIDVYDAQASENLDNREVPVSGTKVFKIPFTVSKPGDYNIPPIHFSWFNPETNQYESSKTEPIQFTVTAGKNNHAITAIGKAGEKGGFLSLSLLETAGSVLLGGGLVALLFFTVIRKRSKESDLETVVKLDDLENEKPVPRIKVPGNPLQSAEDKLISEDPVDFYKTLDADTRKYLSDKLRIPLHELSRESILKKLDDYHVTIGTVQLFESLMKDVDMILYAKSSNAAQRRSLYEKASGLVALLDKQIKNQG